MTLGQRLRELRDHQDISLREFARKLHCSAPYWSDVELGRRYASEDMLKEAARILKTSFVELKALDTRPPLEEVKRVTAKDPQYAIALRRIMDGIMDSKLSPEELLKIAGQVGHKKRS